MLHALLLIFFFVVVSIIWIYYKFEFFTVKEEGHYPGYNTTLQYSNTGDEIWQRHPVQISVLDDIKARNKKAFSYELENNAYLAALNSTFQPNPSAMRTSDFTVVEPVNYSVPPIIKESYEATLVTISNKVKTSPYFQLPNSLGAHFNDIQVVHDKLISYQRHHTLPSCVLNIELILYRDKKSHAKHVSMSVLADKNKSYWNITVLSIKINGVVFEDQIGLFPVVPIDPLNTNENLSIAEFSQPKNIKFDQDVQFLEFCASTNLDESKRKACIEVIGQTK